MQFRGQAGKNAEKISPVLFRKSTHPGAQSFYCPTSAAISSECLRRRLPEPNSMPHAWSSGPALLQPLILLPSPAPPGGAPGLGNELQWSVPAQGHSMCWPPYSLPCAHSLLHWGHGHLEFTISEPGGISEASTFYTCFECTGEQSRSRWG